MIDFGVTTDSRTTASTFELGAALFDSGFRTVGLGVPMIAADTDQTLNTIGLRCHELMAQTFTDDNDATIASAQKIAAVAETANAEWVLGFFASFTAETPKVASRVADIFAEVDTKLALEFTAVTPLNAIAQARELLEVVGPERSGIIVDTWHFFNGPSTWDDLQKLPLENIAYVQWNDGLPPVGEDLWKETMNRRTWGGEGTFELNRFADTLLGRGWSGTVSVEVLNEEHIKLPIRDYAKRAYDTTAPYWS